MALAAEPVTEITVEAPRVTRSKQTVPPLRVPIDIASIKYRVSFADLDLATSAGAAALEARIKDAATRGCKQLETLAPTGSMPVQDDPPCVKSAVDGAMVQARAAIAAAAAKPNK